MVEMEVQAALVDPRRVGHVKFVSCAETQRETVESGELAVARLEVGVVGAGEQVAVEVRRVLTVIAYAAVENEVPPGLRVVELERVAGDAPGIVIEPVLPGNRGPIGQVVLQVGGSGSAGACVRSDLRREREAVGLRGIHVP